MDQVAAESFLISMVKRSLAAIDADAEREIGDRSQILKLSPTVKLF